MTLTALLLIPLVFGLVGAITPCALGINAVFLGYVTGKSRVQRIGDWLRFALARAALLTLLGLAFGLLGQALGGFVRAYQHLIAWGLIGLGAVFILSRFRRLPLPTFHVHGERFIKHNNSALALARCSAWTFRPAPALWCWPCSAKPCWWGTGCLA